MSYYDYVWSFVVSDPAIKAARLCAVVGNSDIKSLPFISSIGASKLRTVAQPLMYSKIYWTPHDTYLKSIAFGTPLKYTLTKRERFLLEIRKSPVLRRITVRPPRMRQNYAAVLKQNLYKSSVANIAMSLLPPARQKM